MVEIEHSVMAQQCLSRRIGTIEAMRATTTAWAERRNAKKGTVRWQFTTEDARTKRARLYPQIDD